MNDSLSDELEPGEALHGAAQLLSAPVPLAEGLPDRIVQRRARRRRERRLVRGAVVILILAVGAIILRRNSTDRPVTFALDAPTSHSVALVGDFTEWRSDKILLHPGSGGKWEVTVQLPPGRYRFAYLVDHDEWRADAEAAPIPDDYGRPTSVVTVMLNQ